ncbi:MAG: hypothetical protein M3130_03725 [Actinomycetota bacterium]|nr:hypothetical protein [Actinomycetota bacterium]
MHHHNHYYGQAHIMARYCGLNDRFPPPIPGYLQHGWNVLCGWNPVHEFYPGAWRFVWSDGPRRRGYMLGRREYHVVGAAWNYLLAMEPELGAVPDEGREGTLWFLFHGWERGQVSGEHARLVEEIKDTEPGPVTMCLYYTEYRRPEVRAAYVDAGFRVISFGQRGWMYDGTNRTFLYQQLRELRRHRRVASNRLSTAIFYGISTGCEPAVYGDPMLLEGENPDFGGDGRIGRLWPELLGKDIDPAVAGEVAARELGAEHLHSPEELRQLFDWAGHG